MGKKSTVFRGLNEPLNNYVVDVINKEGENASFKTLAHTPSHARQKIYAKFCHLQDDITKYSMGRSTIIYQNTLS